MQRLRHSRNFGRFLAAWLLAWFAAMCFTAPAREAVAAADEDRAVAAAADGTEDAAGFDHADHAALAAHAGHETHAWADAAQPHRHDVHASHAGGSSQHCPLCLHAAVPPPPQFEQGLSAAAPVDVPAAAPGPHPRVRTDVPPPARAPPRFS